jgi:hypothetical protein
MPSAMVVTATAAVAMVVRGRLARPGEPGQQQNHDSGEQHDHKGYHKSP